MAKVPPKNRHHDAKVRRGYRLSITGIRYVSAPDAEVRLSRAVDILLGAATQNTALPGEGGSAQKGHSKETLAMAVEDKERWPKPI